MKPTALLLALALAGTAAADQIVVDRPPDQHGHQSSSHYNSLDPSVPLNTFFGYSYIGVGVQEIPGYRLSQLQLYLGSYVIEGIVMDQFTMATHGGHYVDSGWHGHYSGAAFDIPAIDPNREIDPLPLVAVDMSALTSGNGRLETDLPDAEGVFAAIEFGRVRSNANEPFIETDCDESWVMPPRDCQTRDGDWALAYRATYTQVPEPPGTVLLVLFLAGAWLGMVWWRR